MSTRDRILAALRDAGPSGLSGEELAGRLGVSRVAVGKHVAALRAAGYEVRAVPGRGYEMLAVPDLPLPAEVRRLLHGEACAWELTGGGPTGSTNADAVALAREGAPHGTAVLASEQSAGKGRLGRQWESPAGGVYVSVILRPPVAPAALTALPLAIAWGVAAEVEERSGIAGRVGVKWPNDLVLRERGTGVSGKLGGVLLEIAGEPERTSWVVVGVGLNVHRPDPPVEGAAFLDHAGGPAEALAEAPAPRALASAAAAVLDGIARGYDLLLGSGVGALRDAVAPFDVLRGSEVCVRDIHGGLVAEGIAEGVDDAGRLLVRAPDVVADGLHAVSSGDVTLAGDGITGSGRR